MSADEKQDIQDENPNRKGRADKIDGIRPVQASSLRSSVTSSNRVGTNLLLLGALVTILHFWFFHIPPLSNHRYAVCSKSKAIYTADKATPQVECMLVEGSRISAVGTFDEVHDFYKVSTCRGGGLWDRVSRFTGSASRLKVFTLQPGHIIVPGLADAHAHILEYGFVKQLPLAGSQSTSGVVNRIKSYINSHPDVKRNTSVWIEGMGWDQTRWPGARFPTADDLASDELLRGRPIALRRVDGHALWVSLRVLELMGDLPESVDGGEIIRDSGGRPTGVFVDNAMSLVPSPPWSDTQILEYFHTAMKDGLAHGLTSIHDAATPPEHIAFYKRQAEAGNLPIHVYLMGNVKSDEYWGDRIPRLVDYGKHGRLNVRSVKLVADGALGSWGAALLEPYSDNPASTGLMLYSPETLSRLVRQFYVDQFHVNIHCIGDRANKVVLDIFEDIIRSQNVNVSEWRPRIEHAQIMTLSDIRRIGKLGVIPSVQPTHATSDMWYAESRLGPERSKGAYAYASLWNSSWALPLGSDFPVESINPILGFYAAISRLSVDGASPHGPDGWFPEERLTREQALLGMTLHPAIASFAEHDRGRIAGGQKADFVLLDRDIMTVPLSQIPETSVKSTIVDGKVAYGSLGRAHTVVSINYRQWLEWLGANY